MSVKIYSVEDDKDIAAIINKTLTHQGYEVFTFYDGKGLKEAMKNIPDIILLDIMLPDISGIDILKELRFNHIYDDVRIIMVSAKNMLIDKVDALDMGADDYIEKPFDLLELMSRVAVQARRISKNNILDFKGLELNIQKRACLVDGEAVELSGKEFEILNLLFKAKGNIVTREEIFACIWSTDATIESRTLDMHIKSLRKKLKDKGNLIKTVYGVGYRLEL